MIRTGKGGWATRLAVMMHVVMATPVPCQGYSGIVTDALAKPIRGAIVTLWRGTSTVGILETDNNGHFTASREQLGLATSIGVRAIGYAPQTLPLPVESKTPLAVMLAGPSAVIDPIIANEHDYICPTRTDPRAAKLWNLTRHRYVLQRLESGFAMEAHFVADEYSALTAYATNQALLASRWSQAFTGKERLTSTRWMVDSGYAFRIDPRQYHMLLSGRQYLTWWYPRLDRWDADHFARPLFLELNHLQLVHEDEYGWTIAFCTHRQYERGIIGTLEITRDTMFKGASWRFTTPRPLEQATGEVAFVAAVGGPLMPLRSLFRRTASQKARTIYQEEAIVLRVLPYDGAIQIPIRH